MGKAREAKGRKARAMKRGDKGEVWGSGKKKQRDTIRIFKKETLLNG